LRRSLGSSVDTTIAPRRTSRTPRRSLSTALAPLYAQDVPGKGRGVFANRTFHRGEQVLVFGGQVKDVDAYSDLTHALQVGPRDFLCASGGIDDYVNHSCDPNCGVRDEDGQILLFALRAIRKGEEISFDYATTQTGGFFVFDCQCGAAECRGYVGDFHEMPKPRQEFYLSHGALLSYLTR
jgi:hypothetical protein